MQEVEKCDHDLPVTVNCDACVAAFLKEDEETIEYLEKESVNYFMQQELLSAESKIVKMVNDHMSAMSEDDQFMTYEEAYDDLVNKLVTAEQLKIERSFER